MSFETTQLIPSIEEQLTSSASLSLSCNICTRTFVRREHLKRHMHSHTKEKPFECQTCKKLFTRADILQRHQNSHAIENEGKQKKIGSSFRACVACATGRVRCSGGSPCSSCEKKGTACSYVSRKKRKGNQARSIPPASKDFNTSVEEHDPIVCLSGEPLISSNEVSGSHTIQTLQTNHQSQNRQSQIVGPETHWDQEWMNGQFSNAQSSALAFGLEQSTSGHDYDSINWVSPSSELYEDWGYQLISLAEKVVTEASVFPLEARISNPVPLEQEGSIIWDRNLGLETDFFPSAIATDHLESPSIQSGTRSAAATIVSVAGSDDSQNPSSISYIDNNGARGSRQQDRTRNIHSITGDFIHIQNSRRHESRSNFGDGSSIRQTDQEQTAQGESWVSLEVYNEILHTLHVQSQGDHETFDASLFPTLVEMNNLCDLYYQSFHPSFPFIRKVPFELGKDIWVLVLAAGSIGAKYSRLADLKKHEHKLSQLLQKAIACVTDTIDEEKGVTYAMLPFASTHPADKLPIVQARILNILSMIFSGTSKLMKTALSEFNSLSTASKRMQLLRSRDIGNQPTDSSSKQMKDDWIQMQLEIRAGYMIWILDYVLLWQFNEGPRFDLADAQAPLPCSEEIWDCSILEDQALQSELYTLSDALEILYTEKRIVKNIGEFSRILLVQAISRQTMEMYRSCRNRMSSWIPSAAIQSRVIFSGEDLWPPSTSIMSKWRNSACDCLDILHWSANAKVAQSEGLEHPTILHLHLARLIILTPIVSIREVANYYTMSSTTQRSTSGSRFDPQNSKACYQVLQWAIRDQYKARLSLVHAGAIFWYIRRYSCDNFMEPLAMYLATLVIWAYSVSAQFTKGETGVASDEDSELEISVINLDRPCDDESVQIFVRLGHKLTSNMVRIGDIRGNRAPQKILREGIRLLNGGKKAISPGESRSSEDVNSNLATVWGISQSYIHSLQQLEAATVPLSSDVD